jgi:hypothetical protein
VSTLEQRLHELGRELAFPPEPELAPAVLGASRGRPFAWRKVALGAGVAVVALAAALAVPHARSSILRFFHLHGATVERVGTLPVAEERARAGGLGQPVSLQKAERRLGVPLALPPLGARPRRAYVAGDSLVTLVLRAHGTPVLLSEFDSYGMEALKKLAASPTTVEPVQVQGAPALWLEGGPHTLSWIDRGTGFRERPVLVHGNVLLWLRGRLTLRLEGRLKKAQALELARSVR